MSVRLPGAQADPVGLLHHKLDRLLLGQSALADQQARLAQLLLRAEAIDPDRLYSRADAAHLLSVHIKTIDRWARAGVLAKVKRGGRTYFTGRSITARQRIQSGRTVEVLPI